ncbi:hypothetical protein GGI20_005691 [Coemansia sp. BCRC 34301]|nr:hypothetical protein GGI20_005691 [Coemansia sp. BCRC 34301]
MSGRGHRDNANFLDRIKNVEALKSPYPRHLLPASRIPVATTPTVRPSHGGSGAFHSPARPIPAPAHAYSHAPPVWQNPVARPHTLALSPVSTVAHPGSALYGYHTLAANHRLTPDYPSSVQPIRARAYASPEQRLVPGSSRPSHLSGTASYGDTFSIYNWHICIDSSKRGVIVMGSHTKPSGETVTRHSSHIKRALDSRTLLSVKDKVYVLVGPVDEESMRAKGVPEYLVPSFRQGFPANWEKLVDDSIDSLANIRHDRTRSLVRSHDFVRPDPLSLIRDDSSEGPYQSSIAGNHFSAIEEVEEVPESEPPASSGLSGSFRDLAFSRTARTPKIPDTRPHGASSSSVYRSGSSLFAAGRFAKPSLSIMEDNAKASVPVEIVSNHQDEQSDDGFNVMTHSDSVDEAVASPEHEDGATAKVDIEPSDERDQGSSILPAPEEDVGMSGESLSQTKEPISESPKTVTPSRVSKGIRAAAGSDVRSSKRKPRSRAIESSDESVPNDIVPTTQPKQGRRLASRAGARLSAGALTGPAIGSPVSARKTRRASLNTPSKSMLELTPKSGSRHKGNSPVSKKRPVAKARRNSAIVAAESPEPPAGEDQVEPMTAISSSDGMETTPTKRRARVWRQARAAEMRDNELQSTPEEAVPPTATGLGDGLEDENPEADAGVDASAMTTPKRKIGRNYFRYKEPEQKTSITRSGRKINKPKEWWANAQERLSEVHKESNFKYRWGSGDAVIVKGGKRVRLSDYYLEDGAGDLLFNESSDAKERDESTNSHSKAAATSGN